MPILLRRRYEAEVAHQLRAGVPEGHPCRRLHGHRYVVHVEITGPIGEDGMIVEYAELDRKVMPVIALIDHHDLNSLSERCTTEEAARVAANPTVELLASWLGRRLRDAFGEDSKATVVFIDVEEDSRSSVRWLPWRDPWKQ